MSNEEHEGDLSGRGTSGETPPSVATIVDSTVKVLLPQLSEKIEQQVSQAVKAALASSSSAHSG